MKGIAFYFMALAAVSALIGMAWGIQMSASGNHALSPAHAHLNLLGWVSLSIFGVYYHLVPRAAETMLAKVHFALAAVGLIVIVPGIVSALRQTGEAMAKLGSVLSILSMLCFLVVMILNRSRA
ncbi:hypothetical protein [Pseudoprimorskyibacter insulae]|uniref:Uncharacterized protein n=1 Tax=Pseudoprimorskyibacter insulae TaxID=1695997 RepID=A0A2R8AYS3_9RHOB|nr:hypothetical protein [Pseudoprimorskyibacter insulae]SPF81160.1 hypothetical protein PRI8871_02981 [Pseudoprimorskyibacter insulae]